MKDLKALTEVLLEVEGCWPTKDAEKGQGGMDKHKIMKEWVEDMRVDTHRGGKFKNATCAKNSKKRKEKQIQEPVLYQSSTETTFDT